MDFRDGGDLPNIPDAPGAYVVVCTFGGSSTCRLGDILYIGVSNSLRRRIAYALGAAGKGAPHPIQAPLAELQSSGGSAKVVLCVVDTQLGERDLEAALLAEYKRRKGHLPTWNRSAPRRHALSEDLERTAADILRRLGIAAESD